MTVRASRLLGAVVAMAAVVMAAASADGQVTAITPSGGARDLGTKIQQSGATWDITGGTVKAGAGRTNLFHGFGLFSVGPGDVANFSNDTGLSIANIIGRVTGGVRSEIYGTIQTSGFPGSNLYLLNPAGWLFGPGASLNVSGSFHASTAGYLRFDNGETFCVNACPNGSADTLSVAAPRAFGFLGPTPAIDVQQAFLSVPEGRTLSLVGGNVTISDFSFLSAPGGQIQIGSFASAGEATVSGLAGPFSGLGSVQLSNSFLMATGTAILDFATGNVSGLNGGSIVIRAGQVGIAGSTLDASGGLTFDLNGNAVGTTSGSVVISGNDIVVTNSDLGTSTISAFNFGSEPGPPAIALEAAGDVVLSGITGLQSGSLGTGDAGPVSIRAGRLLMSDSAFVDSVTAGPGRGANVTIEAGHVLLEGGARVASRALQAGGGGDIRVTATAPAGSIRLAGTSTGIISQADVSATGAGGTITVLAPGIVVDNGATIGSSTLSLTAPAGSVTISGGDLTLSGGGIVDSKAFGGAGGDVNVHVTGSVAITGDGSGIFSGGTAGAPIPPVAGDIAVSARDITITNSGVIQNGATVDVAGNIAVTASESITMSNNGKILSQAFSNDVGDLTISAKTLTIDHSLIRASTTQAGRAGDISVNAETLLITGVGAGLFSDASGTGPGGNITVRANQASLRDGATVSAVSTGTETAQAGNISVMFGKSFTMQDSSITTDSLLADGGNISISSFGSTLLLQNSQITTSVRSGFGGGGNITLGTFGHPISIIVLDNSGIHADAFGGPGGNINIFADVFLANVLLESAITASSQLNRSGTINVNAIVTNLSNTLAELPSGMLQVASLLRASCAARMAEGKASSLVVAGREGVPVEPGGLLPSDPGEPRLVATETAPAGFVTELPALRLAYLDSKCAG